MWRGEHRNGAVGTKPIPTLSPVADGARHSFDLTSVIKLAQHTRYLCGVSAGAFDQSLRARRHSECYSNLVGQFATLTATTFNSGADPQTGEREPERNDRLAEGRGIDLRHRSRSPESIDSRAGLCNQPGVGAD